MNAFSFIQQKAKKYLIPVWWKDYTGYAMQSDIVAGLTIGVMLIPQGMTYAMLAGMPAIYGLYAAVVPPLFYTWLGSSRRLAVGPAAITCIMVSSAVGGLAAYESPEYISYVALLSVLVGVTYIIILLLRLSRLARWFIPPITKAFACAAGIIIIINQLKYILGVEVARSPDVFVMLKRLTLTYQDFNLPTIIVGITATLLLYFLPKWKRQFPTALFVILLSIAVVFIFQLDQLGVATLGHVPQGLPHLLRDWPEMSAIGKLWPKAIVITLVGFAISISVAEIVAERNGVKDVRPRRELLSIGLANIASGLFSTIPINGSLSRTMVNDQSGARSAVSLVFAALLVVVTLFFLTPIFFYLPKAVLGAVIIVAIMKLITPVDAMRYFYNNKWDFATYMLTFLGVLLISIEIGIVIGVVFSQLLVVAKRQDKHH